MRPRQRHQVGAAGGEDRIGVVGLVDIADRHGRQPRLVADPVAERRLEHAAIDRLLACPRLAGGNIDQVGAGAGEGFADRHRVLGGNAVLAGPVGRRNADRHRPLVGPSLTHRRKNFEREAQAVRQAPAIFVAALVLQRGDEAGQQIAVGGVQLDHVEAGFDRHPRRSDELVADQVHVGAGHGLGRLVGRRPGHVAGRHHRPIALRKRLIVTLPTQFGRAFPAGMAELEADFRLGLGMDEIDDPLPLLQLVVVPHAGAARADPPLGRHAGHLGEDQAGATQCPLAQMDEVEVVGDAIDR